MNSVTCNMRYAYMSGTQRSVCHWLMFSSSRYNGCRLTKQLGVNFLLEKVRCPFLKTTQRWYLGAIAWTKSWFSMMNTAGRSYTVTRRFADPLFTATVTGNYN